MKRIFTLLLSCALLLTLAACGGSKAPAPTDSHTSTTVAPPAESLPEAPTQSTEPQASMAETILVDNEQVTFAVVSAQENAHTGMQLKARCVNKTDRTLLFSWDMVSVCGYMYDPLWAQEVSGGKTAESTVYLDTVELERMGVAAVEEITFTLRVVDSENWMDEPLVDAPFTVYPTGLDPDTAQLPEHPDTAGQVVIADNGALRFVVERADRENNAGYILHVYMENKTDRNLMFSWDMVSVNGHSIDPFWAVSVASGKKACSRITFYKSDLDDNGIDTVSEVSFTLSVCDYDDWTADYLLNESFTYTP